MASVKMTQQVDLSESGWLVIQLASPEFSSGSSFDMYKNFAFNLQLASPANEDNGNLEIHLTNEDPTAPGSAYNSDPYLVFPIVNGTFSGGQLTEIVDNNGETNTVYVALKYEKDDGSLGTGIVYLNGQLSK